MVFEKRTRVLEEKNLIYPDYGYGNITWLTSETLFPKYEIFMEYYGIFYQIGYILRKIKPYVSFEHNHKFIYNNNIACEWNLTHVRFPIGMTTIL